MQRSRQLLQKKMGRIGSLTERKIGSLTAPPPITISFLHRLILRRNIKGSVHLFLRKECLVLRSVKKKISSAFARAIPVPWDLPECGYPMRIVSATKEQALRSRWKH